MTSSNSYDLFIWVKTPISANWKNWVVAPMHHTPVVYNFDHTFNCLLSLNHQGDKMVKN